MSAFPRFLPYGEGAASLLGPAGLALTGIETGLAAAGISPLQEIVSAFSGKPRLEDTQVLAGYANSPSPVLRELGQLARTALEHGQPISTSNQAFRQRYLAPYEQAARANLTAEFPELDPAQINHFLYLLGGPQANPGAVRRLENREQQLGLLNVGPRAEQPMIHQPGFAPGPTGAPSIIPAVPGGHTMVETPGGPVTVPAPPSEVPQPPLQVAPHAPGAEAKPLPLASPQPRYVPPPAIPFPQHGSVQSAEFVQQHGGNPTLGQQTLQLENQGQPGDGQPTLQLPTEPQPSPSVPSVPPNLGQGGFQPCPPELKTLYEQIDQLFKCGALTEIIRENVQLQTKQVGQQLITEVKQKVPYTVCISCDSQEDANLFLETRGAQGKCTLIENPPQLEKA